MRDEAGGEREDLRTRTKRCALRIIRLYARLPKTTVGQVLGKQVLRSGTSVGAHYHEATRARSDAEFICKLEVGLQELEETRYWLELIGDAQVAPAVKLQAIVQESTELIAILTACTEKAKARTKRLCRIPPYPSSLIPYPSSTLSVPACTRRAR